MPDITGQARESLERWRRNEAHGWGTAYPERLMEGLIAEVERLRLELAAGETGATE